MQGSLILTTMRNEGPFILEWVAWQKVLGFENILIYFNDCSDHSPKLLRLLRSHGEISCRRHAPPKGTAPQPWAFEKARHHPLVKRAKWLFCCDVDEFLVIHRGTGQLSDLFATLPTDIAGVAVNWRIFGDGGLDHWKDGLVHRRFSLSSTVATPPNRHVKCFVKRPLRFGRLPPGQQCGAYRHARTGKF